MRAAEVKKAIEWILSNLDGHYAADSVAAAVAHGAAAIETAQESESRGVTISPYSSQKQVSKVLPTPGKGSDAVNPSNISTNFRLNVDLVLRALKFLQLSLLLF